jgi:formylglycine-generating enzyme required for sulfatase activity
MYGKPKIQTKKMKNISYPIFCLFLGLVISFTGYAQSKRLALVMGNANYQNGGSLANPLNDADDMAKALQSVGFEVILKTDVKYQDAINAINDFVKRLPNYEVGLFYFAGQAVETQNSNYLLPVDVSLQNEEDAEVKCINVQRVLAKMEGAKKLVNIMILDASRHNPFPRKWSRSSGQRDVDYGSLIAYATAPGKTVWDGYGRNSLYTGALLKYLTLPGLSITEVFKKTRQQVIKDSDARQIPWESGYLISNFYFQEGGKVVNNSTTTTEVVKPEPKKTTDLSGMVYVEGGTFQMGSNEGGDDEKPAHSVTLSSFYLSKYEVTVAEYRKFCQATQHAMPEKTPIWGWQDSHPMVYVTWEDAEAYCKWAGGRLPTEAEWEYAARGGNKSQGYQYAGANELDKVAWYTDNSGNKPHSVGEKLPNELGLYDMSGNVSEWCSDWSGAYSATAQTNPQGPTNGPYRCLRGGSWLTHDFSSKVLDRSLNEPRVCNQHYGFRLLVTP